MVSAIAFKNISQHLLEYGAARKREEVYETCGRSCDAQGEKFLVRGKGHGHNRACEHAHEEAQYIERSDGKTAGTKGQQGRDDTGADAAEKNDLFSAFQYPV